MTLSTSDLISLIISLASIAIAILTLRQNNKMIEASTRPYITVYGTMVTIESSNTYFVLKNFGNTGAKITLFSPSCDISQYDYIKNKLASSVTLNCPFENIEGTFLAPQQSTYLYVDVDKAIKDNVHIINFKIRYTANNKSYDEDVDINLDNYYMVAKNRPNPNSKIPEGYLQYISSSLQELVERKL